tara:strand:- start:476 stop:802 length:327 start_codon:yes stop_codon:yes gene_type:complete
MRRYFRADLLIDSPPQKTMKYPKRKSVSRKNIDFENLIKQWIEEAGDLYSNKELAKRSHVQVQTVNKWAQGYQAGKYSLWPIASYFGILLNRQRKELYKELVSICKEF